jgi:RNA polymerase sigma factor (sigma-70 family)
MPVTALPDAELLDQARHGDEAAFTELYVRHQPAALRLASTYRRLGDPEDLVNEAFEKVLAAVRRGGGPTEAFRAYLFVTLRRLAAEQSERPADEPLDNVPEPVAAEASEPGMARADRDIMNDAFESLPDRWQTVLWHTAVEGRAPRELASVLGVSANAAAALAYRAREKLRQAYLQAHLLASPHPECEPHRSRLGAYVRGGLSRRDQEATSRHVDRCESCQALVIELTDVNRMLVRSVLPLFLLGGGAQAAALAAGAGAAAGGVAAGSGSAGGSAGAGSEAGAAAGASADSAGGGAGAGANGGDGKGVWRRARDRATSAGGVAAAAVLVAGLAAAGLTLARDDGGPPDDAANAADPGDDGGNGDGDGPDGSVGPDSGGDDFPPPPGGDPADPFDSPVSPDSDVPFAGLDNDSPGRFGARSPFDGEGSVSDPPDPSLGPSGGDQHGGGPAANPPPPASSPRPVTPTTIPPRPPPRPPPGGGPSEPPPDPPAPPPLGFAGAPEWTPVRVGRGELTVRIGEVDAAAALAASEPTVAVAAETAVPRQLRIELSAEAQPVGGELDPRCTVVPAAGRPTVDCMLAPPSAGATVDVRVPLAVLAPEQSATVTLRRGAVVEDREDLPLDRYEEGLALVDSAWTPFELTGYDLPFGQLTVGAEHLGTRPLPGVSLEVTLAGDAGFMPAVPGVDLLPAGCATPGWPPTGGDGEVDLPVGQPRPPVLVGGLPTAVVCDLGTLTPGAPSPLRDLIVLVRPWYRDGDGVDELPTATVTLKLQDPLGDPGVPPEVHIIAEAGPITIDLPEG